jgi:hypothetical protein
MGMNWTKLHRDKKAAGKIEPLPEISCRKCWHYRVDRDCDKYTRTTHHLETIKKIDRIDGQAKTCDQYVITPAGA